MVQFSTFRRIILFLGIIVISSNLVAQQVIDLTTGVNLGINQAPGTTDSKWEVLLPGSTVYSSPFVSTGSLYDPGWGVFNSYGQDPCGQWISPYINPVTHHIIGTGVLSGTYKYRILFQGNPCTPTSISFDLNKIGADNQVTSIALNSTVIPITGVEFSPLITLNIPVSTASFIPGGLNQIIITVENPIKFTGLMVCGNLNINFDPEINLPPTMCVDDAPMVIGQNTSTGVFSSYVSPNNGVFEPALGLTIPGSTGSITFDPAIAGVGTHEIVYTTNPNTICAASSSAFITVNPLPSVNIIGSNFMCSGQNSTLTAISSNASSYLWSNGSTGQSTVVTSGGIHDVTVQNVYGCEARDSYFLIERPTPEVTLTEITTNCTSTLHATVAGNTSGLSYIWSTGATTSSIVPTSPGTYSVTVYNQYGCSDTETIAFTFPEPPSVAPVTPVLEVCVSDPTLLLSHFSGSFPNFQVTTNYFTPNAGGIFSSSAACGFSGGGFASFDPQPCNIGPNEIFYTYTDPSTGCTATGQMIINVSEEPVIAPIPNMEMCTGDNPVSVIGNSTGADYCYFSGTGIHPYTGVFDPAVAGAGAHTLTYTCVSGGCTASQSFTINVAPSPQITFTAIPPIYMHLYNQVPVPITQASSTGATSCSFSGPGIIDAQNGIFDPNVAGGIGNYEITYTCSSGSCTSSVTRTISVIGLQCKNTLQCSTGIAELVENGDFSAGFNGFTSDLAYLNGCGASTICVAAQATDKCTAGGWQYNLWDWDQGNSSGKYLVVDGVSVGAFWKQDVELVNGQTYIFSFAVRPSVSSPYDAQSLLVEANGQTVLFVPKTTYQYSKYNWYPFCKTFVYTGPTGTFPLTISQVGSSGNADYGIDAISFTTCCSPPPVAAINPEINVCSNDPVLFLTSWVGNFPNYQVVTNYFTPNQGGVFSSDAACGFTPGTFASFDPQNCNLGANEINYTYTNSYGCSATASMTVNVLEPPVISAIANITACVSDEPFAIVANSNGAFCAFSGTGINPVTQEFEPSVAGPGIHQITYTCTSLSGCASTETFTVNVAPLPQITFEEIPGVYVHLNGGAPVQVTQASSIGATNCWYSGPGIIDAQNGIFDPTLAGGIGDYELVYTCQNEACTSSDTQTIYVIGRECPAPLSCRRTVDLVRNGSFSNGNNDFSSDLAPFQGCAQGSFWVGAEPRSKCMNSLWIDDLWDWDQGNASGSYLLIDGQANSTVWEQDIFLRNGKTYVFSFSVMPSISSPYDSPELLVEANGQQIMQTVAGTWPFGVGSYVFGKNNWNPFCQTFVYTGPTGTFPLTIKQLSSTGGGDFGMDAISLTTCCTRLFVSSGPIADIDMCFTDYPPFIMSTSISSQPTSETWQITPSTPAFNTANGEFSPNLAASGTYTITYTATNECYTSSTSQSFSIIGNNNDYWHQTTKNTGRRDIINDVITDASGNVYVVGEFSDPTTLNGGGYPDIVLSCGTNCGGIYSFVAKYSSCGNLLWAANAKDVFGNEGNAITLNESKGLVYITGNFRSSLVFYNAQSNVAGTCASSSSIQVSAGTGEDRGYVAQFDMNTGCVYFVEEVQVGAYEVTDCRSITINEYSGDLFVGGSYTQRIPNIINPDHGAFIQKFSPTTNLSTGNTLGPVVWDIVGGIERNEVNDMDFDEFHNRIWFTGDFSGNLNLMPGGLVQYPIANVSATPQEGFIAGYDDLGTSASRFVCKGGRTPSYSSMKGEGVAVDKATGNPYFTGTYSVAGAGISNLDPYGLVSEGFSNDLLIGSGTTGANRAYFIGINFQNGTAWSRYAETAGAGDVTGTAVTVKGDNVFFTGDFNKSAIKIYGFPNSTSSYNLPYTTSFSTLTHSYVTSFSLGGSGNWGNVTEGVADNEMHSARSITADDFGSVYIVGTYKGSLDYLIGNPSSGTLVSSPVKNQNGFVLRSGQQSGIMQKSGKGSEIKREGKMSLDGIRIAPNPANNTTELYIDPFDAKNTYRFELINSLGTVLETKEILTRRTPIDLSQLQNGMYYLKVTDNVNTKILRVVKAH